MQIHTSDGQWPSSVIHDISVTNSWTPKLHPNISHMQKAGPDYQNILRLSYDNAKIMIDFHKYDSIAKLAA